MKIIELHDDEVDNEQDGTLAGILGGDDDLEFDYQVEIVIQEALGEDWRRAYLMTPDGVVAIWTQDRATRQVKYLARDKIFAGTWELPFVESSAARIAVANWSHDVTTDDEALAWATEELGNAITAIVLEGGEIRTAWELVDGKPKVIARGQQD